MASTNFIARQTVIEADWLNDVDKFVYEDGVTSTTLALPGAAAEIGTADGRPLQTIIDQVALSPEKFGAAGDGVTDDTAAWVELAQNITSNCVVECAQGSVYLVSSSGASNEDAYGKKILYLQNLRNVTIRGNGSTIKVVNHDIAANGGLMWLWGVGCRDFRVTGFRFDMTFTGVKNSSLFYPFCGAIIFPDAQTGTQTQEQLSGDIEIDHCSLKLFHPFGSWATTTAGNSFGGDPNNGYKLEAIFLSGDAAATNRANQNSGAHIHDIVFEDGHNGYGVWVWAYNDADVHHIRGKSWVTKYSSNAGAVLGVGVPMVRYHQFHCSGFSVHDCNFKAKPCNERTVAGFEGGAVFTNLTTNLTGDYSHGNTKCKNNIIVLGNGDAARSLQDRSIFISAYGDFDVSGNQFDGIEETTNAFGGTHIQTFGTDGKSTLKIDSNQFGVRNSYNENIVTPNGTAVSAYARRIKALTVTNNISFSQAQHFLDTLGTSSPPTFSGIAYCQIKNNTIIGTYNTVFDKTNTNSRAFRLAASEASDILLLSGNIVVDKYYFALAASVNALATTLSEDNKMSGVTVPYLGGSIIDFQTQAGTFTPTLLGATTPGSPTITYAIGRYTRTANLCTFAISIAVSSAGGAVGNWLLGLNDLPFTSKNVNANHVWPLSVVYSNLAAGAGKEVAAALQNNSKNILIYLQDQAGGAVSSMTAATDSTFSLWVSGSFEVA